MHELPTIELIPGTSGIVGDYEGIAIKESDPRFDLGPGHLFFTAMDARSNLLVSKNVAITSMTEWMVIPLTVEETRRFEGALLPRFEIEHRNATGRQRRVLFGKVKVRKVIADD